MPTVDKEQFHKAKQFVIKTLQNTPKNKKKLDEAIEKIEEEMINSENKDYQLSIASLLSEMADVINEYNQSQ